MTARMLPQPVRITLAIVATKVYALARRLSKALELCKQLDGPRDFSKLRKLKLAVESFLRGAEPF